MPPEPAWKPHKKPKPYQRKPKLSVVKDAQKTLAKTTKERGCENLTLHDWMVVFAFVDQHPGTTQGNIVKHFASKSDDVLIFMQCTLSRKMKSQEDLKKCVTSYPNALSLKCPRVVTRPDVERAPVL
jgi:hypothetical protein